MDACNQFTPTELSKVSVLQFKNQVNLIETLMIKLISCPCNSQYIKTKLRQINPAKLLKAKKLVF